MWVNIIICILKAMRYYWLMFLETLKKMFRNLWTRPCKVSLSSRMTSTFKKTKVQLELLTDIKVLFMVRGVICHSINRYAKPNNIYMKDYDRNKESSYLKHLNINNLYVGQCHKNWLWMDLGGLNIFLNLMNASWKVVIKNIKNKILL